MVESVICVVIVSGMLVASLEMLGTTARLRRSQGEQCRAAMLARQLMAEIVQYNYTDPSAATLILGPELGETRAAFNDVDDYNGLSETPPKTASGTAIAGYTGWSRSVLVEYADPSNPGGAASLTDQNLKRITITVMAPSGRSFKLVALRSRYSAYEKSYSNSSSYPAWATVSVQIGTDSSTKVTTSVNAVNQVP